MERIRKRYRLLLISGFTFCFGSFIPVYEGLWIKWVLMLISDLLILLGIYFWLRKTLKNLEKESPEVENPRTFINIMSRIYRFWSIQFVILLVLLVLTSNILLSKESMESTNQGAVEEQVPAKNYSSVGDFDPETPFSIHSMTESNFYGIEKADSITCLSWYLDSIQVKRVLQNSHPITPHEWHYLYDHWPCKMEGMIIQSVNRIHFSINAGAWFQLQGTDTTLLFGFDGEEIGAIFLSGEWDPSRI